MDKVDRATIRWVVQRSFFVRGQYIILALLMISLSITGFWQTYFTPLFDGTLNAHWPIDLPAAIFTIWLFLFLGQAVLAYPKKINAHQMNGAYVGDKDDEAGYGEYIMS